MMTNDIYRVFMQSTRFGLLALILFGFGYVSLGVGLGQFLLPKQANGSLIVRDGQVIGSALVAQPFVADGYFHSRPSAANYDVMAVSGSNHAQTNPALRQRIESRKMDAAAISPLQQVPSDFLTQSGSGIDPHISQENANLQLLRVAKARGLSPDVLNQLVKNHTMGRQLKMFGNERVNVLELNLALDQLTQSQVTR